ncbi:MAG: hypothetical protein C0413_04910 [Clostridiales bacterium]|nr:hypothetical protein [Clostridiales bacterium]
MEQAYPHPHHEYKINLGPARHGAGRVIAYFIVLLVFNVLLAVYALYMLGIALAFDWSILSSGTFQAIFESALQLLLFFSPVILTIILNRLLYRVFRGHGRFPRGTWFFAMLAIIIVQVSVVSLIFEYGYADGSNGLNIEKINVTPVD